MNSPNTKGLQCCGLGNRKGIWLIKTPASNPVGMAVNVTWWV